jgi:hypothetical protein
MFGSLGCVNFCWFCWKFYFITLLRNSWDILRGPHFSVHSGIYPFQKPACPGESPCISETHFCRLFAYNFVKLKLQNSECSAVLTILGLSYSNSCKNCGVTFGYGHDPKCPMAPLFSLHFYRFLICVCVRALWYGELDFSCFALSFELCQDCAVCYRKGDLNETLNKKKTSTE